VNSPRYLPPTRDELAALNVRFPWGCLLPVAVALAVGGLLLWRVC
jgi:hypothetical protein